MLASRARSATSSVSRSASGLAFLLPEGATYDIEYSTDLENWTVIAADLSGEINFEDSDAARQAQPGGYYRSVEK